MDLVRVTLVSRDVRRRARQTYVPATVKGALAQNWARGARYGEGGGERTAEWARVVMAKKRKDRISDSSCSWLDCFDIGFYRQLIYAGVKPEHKAIVAKWIYLSTHSRRASGLVEAQADERRRISTERFHRKSHPWLAVFQMTCLK